MDGVHGKRPIVADVSSEEDECHFQMDKVPDPPLYWNEAISAPVYHHPQLVHHKDGEKTRRKQYLGVRKTNSGKWGAQINHNKERVWVGGFDTAEEAASAYDEIAFKIKGIKAKLNFPERVFNSEAPLNPNQAVLIQTPPARLEDPTLSDYPKYSVAVGIPVGYNFNNIGAEMSSSHMSKTRQEVIPSDFSPRNPQQEDHGFVMNHGISTQPIYSLSTMQLLCQQQDEAGHVSSHSTSHLAEVNPDLQTLMSNILDDFTKWEESE